MAERNNLIETVEPKTRKASTVIEQGMWAQSDGAGAFEPLQPGNPVAGLFMENVTTQSPYFAQEAFINVDTISADVDRWLMNVTVGTANANMEGLSFDVDPSDAKSLDVSTPGLQFIITRYISATQVEVKVNQISAVTPIS